MSARDRLTEQLRNPGLVGLDEEEAVELIDAFAHELAGEIREERDAMREEKKDPRIAITEDSLGGMDYAASLIDPYHPGPVRPDEEPTP